MAGMYELSIKLEKIPTKIGSPSDWEGLDVNLSVNAELNEVDLRFVEHDDELHFLIGLNFFLGELQKKTKISSIDFGELETSNIKKLYMVEGHLPLSIAEIRKRLKNLPIDKNGTLKPVIDAQDVTYVG